MGRAVSRAAQLEVAQYQKIADTITTATAKKMASQPSVGPGVLIARDERGFIAAPEYGLA